MTRVTSDVDLVRNFTGMGLLQLLNALGSPGRRPGLPTDRWIERFYDWLQALGQLASRR